MHNGGPHGHHVDLLERSSEQAATEVLGWTERTGPAYLLLVLVLAALAALGVVGFAMKAADGGLDSHHPWGYLAAALAFIMTTSLSAPLVAIAPRFAKSHWNRYVSRIAETWSVVGLLSILIMAPLLLTLPSADGRQTLLMYNKVNEGWPVGAPHLYVALVLVFTAINGFGLLWASAIPDFALAKSRIGGLRGALYSKLALGWVGTKRQWRALRAALGVLGALYFIFIVWSHTTISFDFGQSLVPGLRDSVFPAWQALGGIQSALATVIVTSFVLRFFGGFKEYIGVNQFWSMAKLMLASSLLWMYFWWSGFIIYWYAKTPQAQDFLQLMWFGPYRTIFIITVLCNFALVLGILMWNPVRKSILGPTIVGCLIIAGALLDKVRIYVGFYSVEETTGHILQEVPEAVVPQTGDVLMVAGVIGGALLLYVLALKFVPIFNLWEIREGSMLQVIRPLKRLPLKILAKPE